MSFGFFPGDIGLFLGFASKVIKALRDEGGSCSEYRLAELQCQDFLTVMDDVEHFDLSNLPSSSRSKIEENMTHSREFVNDFKQAIYKYEKAMSKNSRRGFLAGAPRKIQWAISAADDLDKFRQSISAQLSIVQLTISKSILSIVAGSNQPQRFVPGTAHNNALRKLPYHSTRGQGYLDWDYNQINTAELLKRIDGIADLVYERIRARPGLHLANHGRIHNLPDDANVTASYPLLDVISDGRSQLSTHQLDESPSINQRQVEYSGYQHTFADELNEYLRSLGLEELSSQEVEQVNQIKNNSQGLMLNGSHELYSETLPQELMNNRDPPSGRNRHGQSKFRPNMPSYELPADLTSSTSLAIKIIQLYDASIKTTFFLKRAERMSEELLILSKRIMQYSTVLKTASNMIRTSMSAEQKKLAWEIIRDSQVVIEKVEGFLKHAKSQKYQIFQTLTSHREIIQSLMWRRNKQQILLIMGEIESLKSTLSIVLQAHQIKMLERSFENIEGGRIMQRDVLYSNGSLFKKRIY